MKLAQSKVHFIGIGGIGMCGLAELLHNMGAQVSGSDLADNVQTQRLVKLGVKVYKGHQASHISDVDVVVYSSAVMYDNPEFAEARRRSIPIIRRAEALAEIMRLKRGIAIAGSHGKTTTTSLAASIFLAAKMDPTIAVGGRLDVIKSTALLGKGEWMIAEADESDGSFTRLSPELAVITNIDNDHLDHYGSFENLVKAFHEFASRIPFYGMVVACGDDVHIRKTLAEFPKHVIFYGYDAKNHVVVTKSGPQVRLSEGGRHLVEFDLPMPGAHNALNAAAALLVARAAGVDPQVSAHAIAHFAGVDRRFQHKAEVRGIDFYDDYGHHPTEIEAVIKALAEKFPQRRKIVVFQPHRYSRTQLCWSQFTQCFSGCDVLYVMDIYAAGEMPIEGVSSQALIKALEHKRAHYLERNKNPNLDEIVQQLKAGDVVLTLGAGDIVKFGERMLDKVKA